MFAGKNYFCQSGFYHEKTGFSTFWQKLANPGIGLFRLMDCIGEQTIGLNGCQANGLPYKG